VDDAFAAQMALRDRLVAEREGEVIAALPGSEAAVDELYRKVLEEELPRLGFVLDGESAIRPDGVPVRLDPAAPLRTLARLVQEDLCVMQPDGAGEHMLTAATLCFPAGWTLAEKIGRPLVRIHAPVPKYSEDVGRRVQRLFDAIRPETPMWRANAHRSRASLFNPLREDFPKDMAEVELPWIRSERQCLLRLPASGAVVFSIHTYLVATQDLTAGQIAALSEYPIHRSP
jgi:hypothetical protein